MSKLVQINKDSNGKSVDTDVRFDELLKHYGKAGICAVVSSYEHMRSVRDKHLDKQKEQRAVRRAALEFIEAQGLTEEFMSRNEKIS